jgi:hypothetical protein
MTRLWIYFKSLRVITDDQLILGLGIHPELPGTSVNFEVGEGLADDQELG